MRGLQPPVTLTPDGAAGLRNAGDVVWPPSLRMRGAQEAAAEAAARRHPLPGPPRPRQDGRPSPRAERAGAAARRRPTGLPPLGDAARWGQRGGRLDLRQ
jgi:hypothetical protein